MTDAERRLARALWLRVGGPWRVDGRGPGCRSQARVWSDAAAAFGARGTTADRRTHVALVGRWDPARVAAALDAAGVGATIAGRGPLLDVVRTAADPPAVLRGRRPLMVLVQGDVAVGMWVVGRRPAAGAVLLGLGPP